MSNAKLMKPFDLNYINSSALSFDEAKEYLLKYFIVLQGGNHAMLQKNGQYKVMKKEIITDLYLNRISKELKDFYLKKNYCIRELTYELNKDVLYDDYLNLCPRMMHEYIPYKENFDEETKKKVKIMLTFIKEIINNNNVESFDFVIRWLSNMVKGNKNNSCIYLKGIQGLGKSSFTDFFKYYVIGSGLSLETGSTPLKEKFNSILEGKLMVCFEELENVSAGEWLSMSSTLKRIITSNDILIESKNVNSYTAKNINNYFILSNNDAIRDDDGRRYFIADLSTKRACDNDYFESLRDNCFNEKVGHAFYCFLMEVDTNKFNPQKYPLTQSKLDSIAKRLDNVHMFLKEEYVLQKKGIKKTLLQEFYDSYISYCLNKGFKKYNKIDFNKKMTEIGISYFKSAKNLSYYEVSCEILLDIFIKKNWIHELDNFETSEKVKEKIVKESRFLIDDDEEEILDDDEEEILDNVEIEEIQHDLIVDYDKNELDDFLNKF